MKKIISLMLSIALLLTSLTCFAAPKNIDDIAVLLSELDIMKGDPDGNLRLDDNVTRAEFTKVAIASSAFRNSVATNLAISPFKDVLHTYWAAPYIKLAVSNNICKGYPDATFNPDGTVLYEEAVTMLLKVLGYTDNDFGISWPYGQVGIAKKIDLCDNIDKGIGDTLNRRDVMIMVYNLLNTKAKNSNVDFIVSLDYKIVEDTVLIATANEDSSVGSNNVFTSTGIYKINKNFNYDNMGRKGDAILKNNDELVSFIPSDQIVNEYDIYQVLDNDIVVLDNGQLQTLDVDKSLAVYNKIAKTTLQTMLPLISPGDVLRTYRNSNGIIDYGVIKTDELQGPFTVTSQSWINEAGLSSLDNLTIMKDGIKATKDSISVNDIYYYSKPMGIVWAYSNKVTGIYEKALPNKDMPKSVVVSGVTYALEGVSALNKMSSSGNFKYGDTVTLLLGKTNQIADVISPNNTKSEVYGYLIETGTKEFINSDTSKYIKNYVKVALADGGVYEYNADRDYKDLKNSVIKLSFENGVSKASRLQRQSDISGDFRWSSKRLGSYKVSSDINILDITTLDKNEVGGYTTVFPQRLDGVTLNSNAVLFAEKNDKDEITTLILNDVTGDAYKYGIVTKAEKVTGALLSAGSYTYDINGNSSSFVSSNTAFNVYSGQPAKFIFKNPSQVDTMKALDSINGTVSSINTEYAVINGSKYLLSDKVLVYKKTYDYNYLIIPIADIISNNNYNLTAYYDKSISSGGRIRVIVATEK